MKINARENEKGRRSSQPKTEPQPIDTKLLWPDDLGGALLGIRQYAPNPRRQLSRWLHRSQFLQLTFEFGEIANCGWQVFFNAASP